MLIEEPIQKPRPRLDGTVPTGEQFVEAVHRRYGMRPVVPLEFPMEIGDIGTIANDGSWRAITTVRHQFHAVPGRVSRVKAEEPVWEVCTDDVAFTTYARGETSKLIPRPVHARARAEIAFGSDASFAFAASGVTIRAATDLDDLIDKVRLAYHLRRARPDEGRWYRDFVFVFEVADAHCFTAMLAKQPGTTVAVLGKAPVGPPTSAAKLAASLVFGPGSEDVQCVHQREASGRFFRGYRLRPAMLQRWREDPWTRSRGHFYYEGSTPSFEETFVEV